MNCLQLNLQHSRSATYCLMKTIEDRRIDIAFVQEPYTYKDKICGISSKYVVYSSGEGRKRAAIVAANKVHKMVLLTQLSNEDCVVVECQIGNLLCIVASIYFDIKIDIANSVKRLDGIMRLGQNKGIIIGVDSNARSKTWYDVINNSRGTQLEEYLTTSELHILNNRTEVPTFEGSRGSSFIDLTLCNNEILRYVSKWSVLDEESCSDHNIITYSITAEQQNTFSYIRPMYIIKENNWETFDRNIIRQLALSFGVCNVNRNRKQIDNELKILLESSHNIEISIAKYLFALESSCEQSFYRLESCNKIINRRSVPWWSGELTTQRKVVNACRRRYQRTKQNIILREERKRIYLEEKKRYQIQINDHKYESWKSHCTISTANNPWNDVYKLAAGKSKISPPLSTIQNSNGEFTIDTKSTLLTMIDYFVPTDNELNDNQYHKKIREVAELPIDTPNDSPFTEIEVETAIYKINPSKTPGIDGITSNVIRRVFSVLPLFVTTLYNTCLLKGHFPKQWKISTIVPIIKPGKENCRDASKYRPISLINVSGKILEILMIQRIMQHINSRNGLNRNQYGFTPRTCTIDAVMVVKQFIESEIKKKNCVVVTSLDVKGAFDAAWWPSILKSLRDFQCPRNLYELTKHYFSERVAILKYNEVSVQKQVTKGCPQGSCCGPGYWNIQYDSILNLKYSANTKVVAFADDLLVLSKGKSLLEAENYMNMDIHKISKWAEKNKISFNESKSKVMLVSRQNRWNGKEVNVLLNGKRLDQADTIKYLGIYLDDKLNFKNHMDHVTTRCMNLVHALSRSAKQNWGLGHKSLRTIYTGAILPIMSYGAPVWISALMSSEIYRKKYKRVQRLINIKIAKACRTISYEASCTLTGELPICIKLKEITSIYAKIKTLKEAKTDTDTKAAKLIILNDAKKQSLIEWEEEWRLTTKGAMTKEYFPTITCRLGKNMSHSRGLSIFLTGHGGINSYLHRFKLKDEPKCICSESEQTVDHLIYECSVLEEERKVLKQCVSRSGDIWPLSKSELALKYLKDFTVFANSIDFEKLSVSL